MDSYKKKVVADPLLPRAVEGRGRAGKLLLPPPPPMAARLAGWGSCKYKWLPLVQQFIPCKNFSLWVRTLKFVSDAV